MSDRLENWYERRRRTVSNNRMSSMLAKMTCSAFSGRIGCRAVRKTWARTKSVRALDDDEGQGAPR